MRVLLYLLAAVLAAAVLYAVRPARADLDVLTMRVIDDPASGMTTLSTEDFNTLIHYYNLMLAERRRLKELTGCI